MSEQLKIPEEYIEEIRTPEERVELIVQDLVAKGIELSKVTYTNHAEATIANEDFNNYILYQLAKVSELSAIEVKVGGIGVQVTDVSLMHIAEEDEEGVEIEGIAAVYPKKKPLRVFEELESTDVFIDGSYTVVSDVNKNGTEFKVKPHLIAQLKSVEKTGVTLAATTIDLFSVTVPRRAIIALDGTASFSIHELEEVRQKDQIYENVAVLGLSQSILMKQINKLRQILFSVDDIEFSEVQKLEILRRIGRLAGKESKKSELHATVMRELLLDVLGEGRTVRLTVVERLTDEIMTESRIICVIMGVNMPGPDDLHSAPSLAVNEVDMHTQTAEGRVVKFDDIQRFEF